MSLDIDSSREALQLVLVELLAAVAEVVKMDGHMSPLDWIKIKNKLDRRLGTITKAPGDWREIYEKHLNSTIDSIVSCGITRESIVSQLGGSVHLLDPDLVEEIREYGKFEQVLNVAHTEANNLKYKPAGLIRNVLPLKQRDPNKARREDMINLFELTLQGGLADICSHDTSQVIYAHKFSKMHTSGKTAVQRPHLDFELTRLGNKSDEVFIGFFPLTKGGMYLEVWLPNNDRKAKLLFIPYGTLLMLPGNTIHAGGFSTTDDGNPRCHLYLFPGGVADLDLKNIYADGSRHFDEHYFHADSVAGPEMPTIFI